MNKFLILVVIIISVGCIDLNTIPEHEAFIAYDDKRELDVAVLDYDLEAEEFFIETDKYGNIISVDSDQEPLVTSLLNKQVLPKIDSEGNFIQFKSKIQYRNNSLVGFKLSKMEEEKEGKIYTAYKFAKKLNHSDYDSMKPLFIDELNEEYRSAVEADADLTFDDFINISQYNFEDLISEIMNDESSLVYEDYNWKFSSKF